MRRRGAFVAVAGGSRPADLRGIRGIRGIRVANAWITADGRLTLRLARAADARTRLAAGGLRERPVLVP
ncbi:hypothetical protein [Kitasatospora sp. NPDC088779]|uniref:hypothetical protein n=1 Tax=Kitasatospora sp. NPDC088779 TaxID=3154964 RepID=UPI003444B2B1